MNYFQKRQSCTIPNNDVCVIYTVPTAQQLSHMLLRIIYKYHSTTSTRLCPIWDTHSISAALSNSDSKFNYVTLLYALELQYLLRVPRFNYMYHFDLR